MRPLEAGRHALLGWGLGGGLGRVEPGQFGSLDAAKVACDTFMTMLENGASVEEVKKAKALCLT